MTPTRILVIGGGGREHALAWKLAGEPGVNAIHVAPGSAAIGAEPRVQTHPEVVALDARGLVRLARQLAIELAIIGPEAALAAGVADALRTAGIPTFGPSAAAARIEASKAFCRDVAAAAGVPMAEGRAFTDPAPAVAYARALAARLNGTAGVVVKADGLAAGKGVTVCESAGEAEVALAAIFEVGDAATSNGARAVVEERLVGPETSLIALCDGRVAIGLPPARDHKRLLDGDGGPNTGGMGAYSPSAKVDARVDEAARDVVQRVMAMMAGEGHAFNGTLFPGLIIAPDGSTSVLEFNARFGDPETQVIIPRLENDLFEVCKAAAEGRLAGIDVRWANDCAVGVNLASGGYPATYKIGYVIEGLDAVDSDVMIFHAGTKNDARGIVTNGGRVLTVVARAATIPEARAKAYDNVRRIRFVDMQYRTDIAAGID